ncbi:MAG: orotidine-5'-phosphate decarboxylase [Candidatus Staskawiczbacteria bacterium]|nr:orotidine-5'-phosphate decarboxylase [Candidatus Staskawiczbacteria bacterium]
MDPKDRIILPLDVSSAQEAQKLVDKLTGHVGMFKIGLELIYSIMASLLVEENADAIGALRFFRNLMKSISGAHEFLDTKLADIPNTVGKASLAVSSMGVKFFNVHASAGLKAIEAAVANRGLSQVLGVTVLTSIGEEECRDSIFGDVPGKKVLYFAKMLKKAGASGIICSPQELVLLRENHELDDLLIVTPGVRPEWASTDDQKRVMTPGEAIKAGADYLVIGRPITKPPESVGSPVDAAKRIADEIQAALS